MPSSAMQILAFALALLGILGATVATLLPNWKVSADVGTNIMTSISQMQGLWMDCAWYSTGVFSCTLKYSVLALPAYLQTARTTMVLSCMVGTLGLCLAALGLKCTRWGGSHRAKSHTAIAAGGCFMVAGVLCLVPASWFTNEVITTFLDSKIPETSKYEPGGAVYVAFISAGFLLAASVIFCLSCPSKREGPLDFGSSHPDKLVQHQVQQEQVNCDKLRREQQRREQQQQQQQQQQQHQELHYEEPPQSELPEREQPHWEKLPQEKLQSNDLKHETPKKLLHEKGEQYYSPSRNRPQDIRTGYILQDYV